MDDMSEHYSDHHCYDCGEDLFQLDGNWYCPECDGMDTFNLTPEQDSFEL